MGLAAVGGGVGASARRTGAAWGGGTTATGPCWGARALWQPASIAAVAAATSPALRTALPAVIVVSFGTVLSLVKRKTVPGVVAPGKA